MSNTQIVMMALWGVFGFYCIVKLISLWGDITTSRAAVDPTRWIHKGTCTATVLNDNGTVVAKNSQVFTMEHDGKPDPYSQWRFGGENSPIRELGSTCTVTNHGSLLDCSWMDGADGTAKTFTNYEIFGVKTEVGTFIDFSFQVERSVRIYPTGEQVGDTDKYKLQLDCSTE